jgi:hypothetical protein
MAPDHTSGERLVAWASGREQRKGLRPRDAAILIIIASFLLLGGLAFLTVIIAMITGGFVARYQRETSAAGEDHISQGMEQLSLELKELRAEVQEVRAEVQGLRPIGQR